MTLATPLPTCTRGANSEGPETSGPKLALLKAQAPENHSAHDVVFLFQSPPIIPLVCWWHEKTPRPMMNTIQPWTTEDSPEFDCNKKCTGIVQFLLRQTSVGPETSTNWFVPLRSSKWYITFLGLVLLCRKSRFPRQIVINCELKFVSFCVQDQLGLEIRNRDHSQTCFDVMNQVAVTNFSNELRLKSSFFKLTHVTLFYV